jgi:2-dehydro-3-deoxyphosphogluconate aldolase/(4S)-4-hydroxy-2-oxoglutarate aldolase
MTRQDVVRKLEESGIIAVIRLNDVQKLEQIIGSLLRGGVKAMEITTTTPDAIQIIRTISEKVSSDFFVGVGTVLDPETARAAIQAGAQFVVSPVLNIEVIKMAHRYDRAMIPGAFTPTEILHAWDNGADIVKVFPATTLGPKYFKDIHGPLPQIKLTPTGGVNLDNAADFMRANASCLGVGTALLDKKLIKQSDWKGLTKHASTFVEQVKIGRASK